MRRLLSGILVLSLGLAALSPAALGAGTEVRVTPGRGGIHTRFVLRFSIPVATGITAGVSISDFITVRGRGHPGCVGQAALPLRSAPANTAFTVALDPAHLNGNWCTGRFSGSLVQSQMTICRPGPVQAAIVCPAYVLAPRVIARFHFTVTQPEKTMKSRSARRPATP